MDASAATARASFSVLPLSLLVTERLQEFLVGPWVTTIKMLQGDCVSSVKPLKVVVNSFVVKAHGNPRCAVQYGYYQPPTCASFFPHCAPRWSMLRQVT